VDGKRAYDRARAGEDVTLPARKVTIYSIAVGKIRRDETVLDVQVDVHCSSGTYIRAIARDLGQKLGVGGHLTALRRTTVGPFDVEDALDVDDIAADKLMSLADVARQVMPSVNVTAAQTVELGHGKTIFLEAPGGVGKDAPVAAVDPTGRLVAIVSIESGRTRILVGFPAE